MVTKNAFSHHFSLYLTYVISTYFNRPRILVRDEVSSDASPDEEVLALPSIPAILERSTLLAKDVKPLMTEAEVSSVTRLFDPATNSSLSKHMEEQIKEYEWLLKVEAEDDAQYE